MELDLFKQGLAEDALYQARTAGDRRYLQCLAKKKAQEQGS